MRKNKGFKIRTTKELFAKGWSKVQIARAKRHGEIFSVFRGVYTDQEITPELVAHALLKARPDVVFEKRTAFEIYTGKPLTFPLQARVPTGALLAGARGLVEL